MAQYGYMFEGLNAAETPDAGTVTVRFQNPFVPFVNYAASHNMPVLAHEIYDKNGNLHTVTDSSGTTTYTYNDLNQLVSIASPDGSTTYITLQGTNNLVAIELESGKVLWTVLVVLLPVLGFLIWLVAGPRTNRA